MKEIPDPHIERNTTMFANTRPTAKKTLKAAVENKYTGPVVKTAAVPVLAVAFVGLHVKEEIRVRKEIRTAKKNGTL
jgi:hypothetical protein